MRKKPTEAQKRAGAANLKKWQEEHGHGQQSRTHGVYSTTIRQRYADGRTTQGKQLQAILRSLEDDLGGVANLTAGQTIILAGMRGKIIVILQMSNYLDNQISVISEDGELKGFLKQPYLHYCESVGRDIERLYKLSKRTVHKIPSIEDLINKTKEP